MRTSSAVPCPCSPVLCLCLGVLCGACLVSCHSLCAMCLAVEWVAGVGMSCLSLPWWWPRWEWLILKVSICFLSLHCPVHTFFHNKVPPGVLSLLICSKYLSPRVQQKVLSVSTQVKCKVQQFNESKLSAGLVKNSLTQSLHTHSLLFPSAPPLEHSFHRLVRSSDSACACIDGCHCLSAASWGLGQGDEEVEWGASSAPRSRSGALS